MSERDTKRFLGRGFRFPVSVDPVTGRIAMSEHEDDIREAVGILLRTNIGERVMRPDYGTASSNFVFAVNGLEQVASFEEEIREALERFEPRIRDVEVSVTNEDGDKSAVTVNIRYVVRSTNNQYNRVYPFYMLEGAGS